MSLYDLTFQTIYFVDSLEKTDLPGFVAVSSPKNAHRMRAGDFFFALLTITSDAYPSDNKIREMLTGVPAVYYRTRGSVTLAMQAAAEEVNRRLLEHNRRAVQGSASVHGSLNVGVLHHNALYLLHSGETSTFIFSESGVEQIGPTITGDRSPGTGPKLDFFFHQTKINKGDFIMFCARPLRRWNSENLRESAIKTHHQLRRRLVAPTDYNLTAVAVQAVLGKGEVLPQVKFSTSPSAAEAQTAGPAHLSRTARALPPVVKTPPMSSLKKDSPQSGSGLSFLKKIEQRVIKREDSDISRDSQKESLEGQSITGSTGAAQVQDAGKLTGPADEHKPRVEDRQQPEIEKSGFFDWFKQESSALAAKIRSGFQKEKPSKESTSHEKSQPVISPEIKKKMSAVWFKGRSTAEKLEEGTRDVTKRLLPERDEFGGRISPFTMLFIAVAVPLVIVAIASTVYIRSGDNELFASYSEQAMAFAEEALNTSDPVIQRNAWTQALYYVDKAENYYLSQELEDIRSQAQSALDSMEGVMRLSLKSATGRDFPGNVNITRMAASTTDLYLLDSNKGQVLRFFLTGQGYKHDETFSCAPGPMGVVVIRPLIDLVVLPVNNILKATVMAADSSGNLLFCIPGENPVATTLTPPDANWGEINAIDLQDDTLYLMDPPNNAVWYIAGTDLNFSNPPRLYFDTMVPNMDDAVDFSINGDALYILHEDDQMTLCTFARSAGWETKCTDPQPYGDNRDGRGSQLVNFPEANFSQMVSTKMPDSSIYILDTNQPAIYHFSLRLNLQKLLMPLADRETVLPEAPVTAFAVSQNRLVYVAYGGEVFYAPLP